MKHLSLVTLFILLSLSLDGNAQTYFGFKVGSNLSYINGDASINGGNTLRGFKLGMHTGVVSEIVMSDVFSIQPELLFSMQGGRDRDNKDLYANNYYITLPILVRYFASQNISVDAGPQIGFLVFSKTSNGFEEWTDTDLNPIDYGLNIGMSYEMDNGMNVNLRYNYNFANIFKSETNLKGTNEVVQLSLGYKFY